MSTFKLTEKETELISDILHDNFSDGTVNCRPWTWSVCDGSKSKAAVLGSLQTKGLVYIEDAGGRGKADDMTVGFTDEGKKVAAAILAAE